MSFAQFNTDLIVADMFPTDYIGRYLDLGAGRAIEGSNSYLFYLRLWSGITIDPVTAHIVEHKKERPRDIQIQACVGNRDGHILFHECEETSLSTMVDSEAVKRKLSGQKIKIYEVPIFKLDTLLKDEDQSSFDIVSIDVESGEMEVLLGYEKLAGKIVIVEACYPCTDDPSYHEWEHLLTNKGYKCVRIAGVNRIYQRVK